VEKENISNYI